MSIIEENADDAKRVMMQLLFARAEALIEQQERVRVGIERASARVEHVYLRVAELVYHVEKRAHENSGYAIFAVFNRFRAGAQRLMENKVFALVLAVDLGLVLLALCLLSLRV